MLRIPQGRQINPVESPKGGREAVFHRVNTNEHESRAGKIRVYLPSFAVFLLGHFAADQVGRS